MTFDHGEARSPRPWERRRCADRGRMHARYRLDSLEQFLVSASKSFAGQSAAGRIEAHQQDVIAAKSQVEMLQVRQVPNKQPVGIRMEQRVHLWLQSRLHYHLRDPIR